MTRPDEIDAALRNEAAAWVARMERPDATRFQAKLEQWLEADPDHRAAYERIHAQMRAAKVLRGSKRFAVDCERTAPQRSLRVAHLVAASLGLALLAGLSLHLAGPAREESGTKIDAADKAQTADGLFANPAGDIRTIALPDGSSIALDTASRLKVAFDADSRHLTLEQGRARFSVAHERRPFVVHAGNTMVIARGAKFDVAFRKSQDVEIALLEGRVDIRRPRSPQGMTAGFVTTTLHAGEQIVVGNGQADTQATPLRREEIGWPQGMIDCDGLRLDQLLARANLYSDRPIQLGDPSLGDLRASGRFRISDPDRLADNLARLFALQVDRSHANAILLERPSAKNILPGP